MFAPHCPTCRRRVLLSTDHLVRFAWQGGERTAVLRCLCGELVNWDQQPPAGPGAEPEEGATERVARPAMAAASKA